MSRLREENVYLVRTAPFGKLVRGKFRTVVTADILWLAMYPYRCSKFLGVLYALFEKLLKQRLPYVMSAWYKCVLLVLLKM